MVALSSTPRLPPPHQSETPLSFFALLRVACLAYLPPPCKLSEAAAAGRERALEREALVSKVKL